MKSPSANASNWRWKVTGRSIQVALGILWLLDGFLQLQSQMFTNHFASLVIAPAAQFEPILVAGQYIFSFIYSYFIQQYLIVSRYLRNWLLDIILYRRTNKIGLIASMAWGLLSGL